MTTGDGEAGTALLVERALRLAARSGNRVLAGAFVELELDGGERRAALRVALERLGAILAPRPVGGAPDFCFVAATADAIAAAAAPLAAADPDRHPPVLVPLGPAPSSASVRQRLGPGWSDVPLRSGMIGFGQGRRLVALARDEPPGTDIAGADDARARISWAMAGMPATRALAAELRAGGVLAARRVLLSLVLEPKTAALALCLRDAGARVAVFAAAAETDPAVATALAVEPGIEVFAPVTPAGDTEAAQMVDRRHAAAALESRPEFLVDDGAHLIRLAHTEHREVLAHLVGASEETTSGVRPLREMEADGELAIPVIAVNDARTKTEFDNRVGTGESCVFAVADVLDALGTRDERDGRELSPAAGREWTVIGYGPVGEGVARAATALGARVTVVERDAVRALRAVHAGHLARTAREACARADVVVSATGVWHTLDAHALAALRPGTVVAVAGGVDGELELDGLRAAGWEARPEVPGLARWTPPREGPGGAPRGILVVADGAGVNYTAGEGNPVEIMDLSFGSQLAALRRLATGGLGAGLHVLPAADEGAVARAALAARAGEVEGGGPGPERIGGAARSWRVHRYGRGGES